MIDESHELMEIMQHRFKNSDNIYQRPLLRFLVNFIVSCSVPLFLCGTQLRIKDIQMAKSAAGSKNDKTLCFTSFHFYTYEQIKKLFKIFLDVTSDELTKNHQSLSIACYYLQGRPRLITRFLENYRNRTSQSFSTILDDYLHLITASMEEKVFL